jgi:HEAT repeat protein
LGLGAGLALMLGVTAFALYWWPQLALVAAGVAGLGLLIASVAIIVRALRGRSAGGAFAAGIVCLQPLVLAVLLALPRVPVEAPPPPPSSSPALAPATTPLPPPPTPRSLADVVTLLDRGLLREALQSNDRDLRKATLKALGAASNHLTRSVGELIEALNDPDDATVRAAAANTLGQLGSAAKGAYLALFYVAGSDQSQAVSVAAQAAADRIGPPTSADAPLLVSALTDTSPRYRSVVAEALVQICATDPQMKENKDVQTALARALDDADGSVRVFAAEALYACRGNAVEVLPVFHKALKDKTSASVRATAAVGLGSIGKEALGAAAELRDALDDPEPIVRLRVAQALKNIEGQPAVIVPGLVQLLSEKDHLVRGLAAKTLGEIGAEARTAVPALREMLQKDEADLRALSANALGNIGPDAKAALPELIEAVRKGDPKLVEQAVWALGEIGPAARGGVEALREVLRRGSDLLRSRAAHALGAIGKDARDAVDDLVTLLRKPGLDLRLRLDLALALWKVDQQVEEVLPVFLESLHNADAFLRKAATDALGEMGRAAQVAYPALLVARQEETVVDVRVALEGALDAVGQPGKDDLLELVKGLESNNAQYRLAVAQTLSLIGEDVKDAVPALIKALGHPDVPFRTAVIKTLAAARGHASKATPALIKVLDEKDPELRLAAVVTLGAIGESAREAVPALVALLKSPNQDLRLAAVQALGEMRAGARDAIEELLALLKTNDKALKANAVAALGTIGETARDAIPALKELLDNKEDPVVRLYAAQALFLIGNHARLAVPVLLKTLKDPAINADIRTAAAEFLGEIGPVAREVAPEVETALLEATRAKEEPLRKAAYDALKHIDATILRPRK